METCISLISVVVLNHIVQLKENGNTTLYESDPLTPPHPVQLKENGNLLLIAVDGSPAGKFN